MLSVGGMRRQHPRDQPSGRKMLERFKRKRTAAGNTYVGVGLVQLTAHAPLQKARVVPTPHV